jgi:uncharacterized membrane protein
MSGMEAVERVIGLGPTVSVAAVAAPGEARVRALFASSVGYGRVPPTPIEVTVGDASGLWVGVLKPLYQGARISHVAGLEELERALRDYHPETESPRVAAVLAAIVYLQAIGGLTTGSPWTEPLRSPPVADAMHAGQDKDRIRMVERLGGKVD